ncbi:MAG TPA: alpha-galactosidase [Steroidobacteraceae bacterium]|nr:alpha-galactosidase [Steroidobacteraceae bacterium]
MPSQKSFLSVIAAVLLFSLIACAGAGAPAAAAGRLAATPPMGWNDWAHYQCDYTAADILANARALVSTGLAARGYDTVTIDDCWMLKTRDGQGNLQPDPRLFPQGMKPVADAIHALGLKFGIYEDAGSETCGRFAGSGEPQGGGPAHFLADARLFVSWGVDYLKLDGCNVYVRKGQSANDAYRAAYRAESLALAQVGRPIVFSESAPAYFQGQPAWYEVLGWVRGYGQLWREGTDMANFHVRNPSRRSRFRSVLWNYSYNLPLGRFQTPGNWNDPDFIIGGDVGMTFAESRSQLALWSMMSAPLILSSDVGRLPPEAVRILGNRAVLSVDQDPLGRMATLLRRSASSDLLIKPLQGGAYAVAMLNRSTAAVPARLRPADLGFGGRACRFDAHDLWSGRLHAAVSVLRADIAAHDTAIWTIRPQAACGAPARIGAITRVLPSPTDDDEHPPASRYTRCLAAPGSVEVCGGTRAESWEVMRDGALRSGGRCLQQKGGKAILAACSAAADQAWRYDLPGRLINSASGRCLTGSNDGTLSVAACGNNPPSQIWSLPNDMSMHD